MTRKEERNDFIKSYLENYNGDSYEASAEREDIGTACNAAINWADKTMIEKACNWLAPVFKDLAGYYSGAELLDDFKKAMEQ